MRATIFRSNYYLASSHLSMKVSQNNSLVFCSHCVLRCLNGSGRWIYQTHYLEFMRNVTTRRRWSDRMKWRLLMQTDTFRRHQWSWRSLKRSTKCLKRRSNMWAKILKIQRYNMWEQMPSFKPLLKVLRNARSNSRKYTHVSNTCWEIV